MAKLSTRNEDFTETIDFLFTARTSDGIKVKASPVTLCEYEAIADLIEPTFSMTRNECQELVDHLAKSGFIAESEQNKDLRRENKFLRQLLEGIIK